MSSNLLILSFINIYGLCNNTFYFVNDVQPPLLRSWELELIYPEKN